MDEFTADTFVNRDEPIPAISVLGNDGTPSDSESKRERLRKNLSSSKLKEKLQHVGAGKTDSGSSIQDRLFAK